MLLRKTGKTEKTFDVYRITRKRYAEDLTGAGARLCGGRWNSRGVPVVYAAEHRSLSLLEFLVRASTDLQPADMCMVTIRMPEGLPVYDLGLSELSSGWRGFPYDEFTQQIGDSLLKSGRYGMIRVPSAIVEEECNCLIHPLIAPETGAFVSEVNPLYLDQRLLPNET